MVPVMVREVGPIPKGPPARRIIGNCLSTEFANKVKAEAGRRQISLKYLFEEMWALYEKSKPKARS
jgi:hypothetical protein